jgi:hypothetical protein
VRRPETLNGTAVASAPAHTRGAQCAERHLWAAALRDIFGQRRRLGVELLPHRKSPDGRWNSLNHPNLKFRWVLAGSLLWTDPRERQLLLGKAARSAPLLTALDSRLDGVKPGHREGPCPMLSRAGPARHPRSFAPGRLMCLVNNRLRSRPQSDRSTDRGTHNPSGRDPVVLLMPPCSPGPR